jgi:hypothetical protein
VKPEQIPKEVQQEPVVEIVVEESNFMQRVEEESKKPAKVVQTK